MSVRNKTRSYLYEGTGYPCATQGRWTCSLIFTYFVECFSTTALGCMFSLTSVIKTVVNELSQSWLSLFYQETETDLLLLSEMDTNWIASLRSVCWQSGKHSFCIRRLVLRWKRKAPRFSAPRTCPLRKWKNSGLLCTRTSPVPKLIVNFLKMIKSETKLSINFLIDNL